MGRKKKFFLVPFFFLFFFCLIQNFSSWAGNNTFFNTLLRGYVFPMCWVLCVVYDVVIHSNVCRRAAFFCGSNKILHLGIFFCVWINWGFRIVRELLVLVWWNCNYNTIRKSQGYLFIPEHSFYINPSSPLSGCLNKFTEVAQAMNELQFRFFFFVGIFVEYGDDIFLK